MSTPSSQAPFRQLAEYDLKSLLDLFRQEIFLSLNCHAIGTIQSFDATKQTAQVSINYKKTVYGKPFDYPILVDCPIIVLSGGIGRLTFPISAGDTCLVLFNDRDIDLWFASGQSVVPATARTHSFSDGIALVGLRSMQNKLGDYDPDHTALSHGSSTKLRLGDKIHLMNASTDLLTSLELLITALTAFFTATAAASIEPTLGPASTAALTAINTFKTNLESLLE